MDGGTRGGQVGEDLADEAWQRLREAPRAGYFGCVAVMGVLAHAARDEEVDSVLDEIDDILEANAEEFVKGFVQKGGQ